jgi:hypothetical protein
MKSMLQIPVPGALTIGVFCTSKIYGGQDSVFLFRCDLANYKAYYGFSRFRSSLKINRSMSNGLILKMNNGYNGVIRELEKLAKWREK